MKEYFNQPVSKFTLGSIMLLFIIAFSCSSNGASDDDVVQEEEVEEVVELPEVSTNEPEDLTAISATFWAKIVNDGGASITERGICYGFNENPTYSKDFKTKANSYNGSGEFKTNLTDLESNKTYYARAYAINSKGVGYGNQISFVTQNVQDPVLAIGEKVSGAHDIFLEIILEDSGDLDIEEVGIVYNTSGGATIDEDSKIVSSEVQNNYLQRVTGLDPETPYFFRPYAKTTKGVIYSDQVSVSTIKKGNFTWDLWNPASNPDAETQAAYDRITEAFNIATTYYNNFTSIVKHVNVNYSPGTPTADANFDGWINMGAKVSYQKAGTAMHEMAHTVGVGTHWKYAELMQGTWQGSRANTILKLLTRDSNAVIKGDGTHFWPYGINGAHEDSGSDELYMIHALIIQGMKTDGLPSN
ncbi:hypothetical protein [Aestuariibaculum sediminum]|uniref:Fibronectin type-III domain-containing protein n=1 Tax=Aestuariibaculum sediminum TaxID=2770637 RepID=A0A8J6PZD8_9FLAO|nr:hypothetical protein [Aestuariibaculum sediminum]MBD0831547.1 hypothetical protein [Aestuariibaculum sediminum]